MDPLVHLAIIWAAVFAAVVMAKKTRLTPVLYFLFLGSLLANIGILPEQSGAFIRVFAELGIIFIMFALGFEESTDNFWPASSAAGALLCSVPSRHSSWLTLSPTTSGTMRTYR